METPPQTVCRFVITSSDGRRSSDWRVWTGREGDKPTNEVYLAPRTQVVDFKISLHSDGWAQYGLSQAVRDAARPGDRHALLRWELSKTEMFPDWRPLYCLQFPASELVNLPLPDPGPIRIPAAEPGAARVIVMLASDRPVIIPDELRQNSIGILDRANGGHVLLVSTVMPFDPSFFDQVDAPCDDLAPWAIPGLQAEPEPYGWVVDRGADGTRRSTEYNASVRGAGSRPPLLADVSAFLAPWEERPVEINDRGLACAILVMPNLGWPRVFVDYQARCDHQHLADDVSKLISAHNAGQIDHGWGRLSNGDNYTMISVRRVLEELGGMGPDQWAPGPTT